MWTIFGSEGKAVANSDFEPDSVDVAARDERAVFHEEVIPLDEIMLDGNNVRRKPLISLSVTNDDTVATITANCDDPAVGEIPLVIGDTQLVKPPGTWAIHGEAGVQVLVDFDHNLFRGKYLEVVF